MPWQEFCAVIEPFYPKTGNGRPPIGLERMLRLHFLQQWFNLSDPAAEESPYDSLSMREFVGIDLGCEPGPDETTILNVRHLLERYGRGQEGVRADERVRGRPWPEASCLEARPETSPRRATKRCMPLTGHPSLNVLSSLSPSIEE